MKRALLFSFFAASAVAVHAYDFFGRHGLRWRDGDIPMNLQLDQSMAVFPLLDGNTSWNAVAQEALASWNQHVTRVRFVPFNGPQRRNGNAKNEIFFSSDVYGHKFGGLVLAVTSAWRIGSERVEGDTIFNNTVDWNSYRGPLAFGEIDLHRVAAHEFGHTLGLDHPDQAGQVQVALMNSTVSDLDTLALDDIHGARALYPPRVQYTLTTNVFPPGSGTITLVPPPPPDGYDAGTIVTLTARPMKRFRFNFWSGDEIASGRRLRLLVVDNASIVANFSTNGAPVIVSPPRSRLASSFEDVTWHARVRSATRASYQWQHDDAEIPGATNAILALGFLSHDDSGLYSVRITNARGATFSKPARLVVDGY